MTAVVIGCDGGNLTEYQQQIDAEVHDIIDRKWSGRMGQKASYSMTEAGTDQALYELEDMLGDRGVLALPQAVTLATEYNRQYQQEKELLYLQALDLTVVRHAYEANPFSTGRAEYVYDEGDEAAAADLATGFTRLLSDGTRITTSVALAWANLASGSDGISGVFDASVFKPLLRGSDPLVVLEPLTQAERDTIYQLRSFNRFRKEQVVAVFTLYFQALQQLDRVRNAEENYKKLRNLYTTMQKRAEVGRFEKLELQQAEQDVIQARDILIQERKDYEDAVDALKLFLNVPPTVEFKLDADQLAAISTEESVTFTEAQAISAAMELRLDLANARDRVEDARRKVVVAADAVRAELNIAAGGQAGTESLAGLSSEELVSVGLELDLPLDRTDEKAAWRASLITLNQQKRAQAELEDVIAAQVRQAYRDMVEAGQLYSTQVESLELADERFEHTSMLQQYDRASTRDVLDAQEDYLDAQDRATEARVQFLLAKLRFYRDAGVMQIRPDGMWQLGAEGTEAANDQPDVESYIDEWMRRRRSSRQKEL
ncbi:type I secretion outer membrane protein, TolC family [Anaerohalosphaera lusitana]|uniref:Type I secretion outer membrane protein, TolC family n=2 Tax=Anaerohalosphaera lusitana TaxID=1936003 RepID=A0A1U9NIX5_9BACT|nr:type I secretion outer membrane protein, TolC family [Anaerohalosphaera lusitana]